jgi:hypothetical protein
LRGEFLAEDSVAGKSIADQAAQFGFDLAVGNRHRTLVGLPLDLQRASEMSQCDPAGRRG